MQGDMIITTLIYVHLYVKGDDATQQESVEEEHPTPSPEVNSNDNFETSCFAPKVTSSVDVDVKC